MQKPWEVESDWYFVLSRRVFTVLGQRGITLYGLSVLSGVSFYQTARYLREGRRMPAYALFRYARALGVSVSELVGDGSNEPEQTQLDFDS